MAEQDPIKQALRDFVATSNSGKYKTEDELLSKFPELQDFDKQALRDFVATSNSNKYKTEDEIFSKFPEFDSKKKSLPNQKPVSQPITPPSEIGGVPTSPLIFTSPSGGEKPKTFGEIGREQLPKVEQPKKPKFDISDTPAQKFETELQQRVEQIKPDVGTFTTQDIETVLRQVKAPAVPKEEKPETQKQQYEQELKNLAGQTRALNRDLQIFEQRGDVQNVNNAIKDFKILEANAKFLVNKYPEVYRDIKNQEWIDNFYREHPVLETGVSAYNSLIDAVKTAVEFPSKLVIAQTEGLDLNSKEAQKRLNIFDDFVENNVKFAESTEKFQRPDGSLDWSKFFPAIGETVGTMAALIGGARVMGGGNAGLFASSYILTRDSYYKQAREKGLDVNDANSYADAAAGITSLLELVSPNPALLKGINKSGMLDDYVKALAGGRKEAAKTITKNIITKEILPENAQEIMQLYGDKITQSATDMATGQDVFNPEYADPNELISTVALTSAATLLMSGGAMVAENATLRKNAEVTLAKDLDATRATIDNMLANGQITEQQAQNVFSRAEKLNKAIKKIPSTIKPERVADTASLLEEKETIQSEIEGKDPALVEPQKQRIEQINNELKNIADESLRPTDEGRVTTTEERIGEPLEAGKSEPTQEDVFIGEKIDDTKDKAGLPSEVGIRQEPIQAEPIQETGISEIAPSGVLETDEEVTQRVMAQMKPITDEMARVEMEFSNNGYKIDWDYDNEITVTDKRGEIVDPEDLPENLLQLAGQYEKATAALGNFDYNSYFNALQQSRQDIGGIETEFEEVKPLELAAPAVEPDALKDVESTAKALEEISKTENPSNKLIKYFEELKKSYYPKGSIRLMHGSNIDKINRDEDGLIWFTNDKKVAEDYRKRAIIKNEADLDNYTDEDVESGSAIDVIADEQGIDLSKGKVFTGQVDIKKPLDLTSQTDDGNIESVERLWEELHKYGLVEKWSELDQEYQDELIENYEKKATWLLLEGENIYSDAKKKGFDAVVLTDVGVDGKPHKSYGVFGANKFYESTSQAFSEAYHKAKADGSNPELVKAVEELLGQKPSPTVQVAESQAKPLQTGVESKGKAELEPEIKSNLEKIQEETGVNFREIQNVYTKYGEGKPLNEITVEDYRRAEAKRQAEKEPTEKQIADTAQKAGITPQNLHDLYKINRGLFGLDRIKSLASAIAMDRMVGVMAKRAGVTKEQMYGRLKFEKASEEFVKGLSDRAKVLWQIVGENAQLAQDVRDNLQVARDMEAAGKDAKTIRLATGWEKGKDGKWRYEIPDVEANEGGVEELRRQSKRNEKSSISLQSLIGLDNELFKAYPELKSRRVLVDNDLDSEATYTPVGIKLSPKVAFGSTKNFNSVLTHEIQHAIQEIEGFAKGGSPENALNILRAELIDAVKNLPKYKELTEKRENLIKQGKSIFSDEVAQVEKQRDNFLMQYAGMQTKSGRWSEAKFNTYQRLAGEVEARNVQTRMGMTPEQRRETLLSETEDVARDEQIVLFDSKGIQMQVDAWHGSPYQFDKFTTEKIGTGEGAQAFGWGLYFTDLEDIAKNYADKLSDWSTEVLVDNKSYFSSKELFPFAKNTISRVKAFRLIKSYGNIAQAISVYKKREFKNDNIANPEIAEEVLNLLESLSDKKVETKNEGRNLYKVSLHKGKTPDQYTWLIFDKPVSVDIKEKLIEKIEKENSNPETTPFTSSTSFLVEKINSAKTGGDLYSILSGLIYGDKNASLFLLDAGIDGIKYPAESISRGATSDTARGFNYVVFDENAVSIEEVIKFQKDAEKARGAMMISMDGQAVIYALTDPNVSTPLHEMAHVFEHYMTDAERAIVQSWAGTKGWTTQTSEKFARGFEKYLAEGKAPTSGLQKIFDKFKTWLTDIYNGITGSDIDIELNEPMREIYAQMLGAEVVKPAKVEPELDVAEVQTIAEKVIQARDTKRGYDKQGGRPKPTDMKSQREQKAQAILQDIDTQSVEYQNVKAVEENIEDIINDLMNNGSIESTDCVL